MEKNENLDSFEVSDAILWLYPEDVTTTRNFKILGFGIETTQWGKKGILEIEEGNTKYRLTSWNMVAQKKMNFDVSVIGKTLKVEPFNDKKVKVSVI